MTQGKGQTKKKSTVLQSKSGTFTVDPVSATSQSESETFSQDETTKYLEEMKQNIKKDLASGRNKLSNMFTQHSLRERKKDLKRKTGFELSEQETKSKRLPADLLAKLGNEENKSKKRRKDQSDDSGSDDSLDYKQRKPRKRQNRSKKIHIPSIAVQKEYIPLAVPGPSQFGLKRLDKDGTSTAVEKAVKFKTDQLYGASVKRITSQELLSVKKKQQRNKMMLEKKGKKKASA